MEQSFKCSKCGCCDIDVRYIELSSDKSMGDYLACKCKKCEYGWKQEPIVKEIIK